VGPYLAQNHNATVQHQLIYHRAHKADMKAAETSLTALHIPANVHMDTVDGFGPSLLKPPVYELPKDHSKTIVNWLMKGGKNGLLLYCIVYKIT
jgi:hypothetical protein